MPLSQHLALAACAACLGVVDGAWSRGAVCQGVLAAEEPASGECLWHDALPCPVTQKRGGEGEGKRETAIAGLATEHEGMWDTVGHYQRAQPVLNFFLSYDCGPFHNVLCGCDVRT